MAWEVGKSYQTRGALIAYVRWEVGTWIGGYTVAGQGNAAPQSVRWSSADGTSDRGQAHNLLPPGGSTWVAVFFNRGDQISSVTKDTEQEARDFVTQNGGELISVSEVTF